MKAKAVTLVRRCKTPTGWRRYPAAIASNGRVLANAVIVDGKNRIYPEGVYQLRTYRGRTTVYRNVGNNPHEVRKALDDARRKARAKAQAMQEGIEIVEAEPGSVTLETHLKDCIDELITVRKVPVMADVVRLACDEFLAVLPKGITSEEIKAKHLQQFIVALGERGLSKRTIENRFANVLKFLRFAGVRMTDEIKRVRPPKSEMKVPEYYRKEERDAFIAACTTLRERLIFGLALKLGLREQELMYIEPREFDFEAGTVTIHSKSSDGFQIKDKEERVLPVPKDLLADVQAYIKANPGIRWLTGRDGDPDGHLLRLAQRIGRRAKLKCRVFLHKFRATYATTLLRNGVDIKTVQRLMGHSDLSSTLKYLRAIEAADASLQQVVNKIDW